MSKKLKILPLKLKTFLYSGPKKVLPGSDKILSTPTAWEDKIGTRQKMVNLSISLI